MADRTGRETIELLELQLRDVRRWTDKLLARAQEDWLYRRVAWTDNTIAWHMGHLAWQQDQDGAAAFGSVAQLDSDWTRFFGFDCEVFPPDAYPPAQRVRAVFASTCARFLEQLGQVDEDRALLQRSNTRPDRAVLTIVVNIIYHEGEHSAGIGTLVDAFERGVG